MAEPETYHTSKTDRYPGIKAFERNQANLFKGREKETENLYKFIKAGNCVVLFSKSGLGKSSLLNAGLSPLLIKSGYMPVSIRLQPIKGDKTDTPLAIVKANLKPFAGKIPVASSPEEETENLPLWEYVKSSSLPLGFTPVLLLDQFEEFFYNSEPDKIQFLNQLKELLHFEPPVRILDWYKKIPVTERTTEQIAWCTQPAVKVVIAIREDRFGELNSISTIIPNIMSTLFKLEPLSSENAKEAIEAPAGLEEPEYIARAFGYDPVARDLIIKKLSAGKTYLETTQLQIVCSQIESDVKKMQATVTTRIVVTADFFGGEQGIDSLIRNFYNLQIDKLPEEIEKKIAEKTTEVVENKAPEKTPEKMPDELIKKNARELIETKMVLNSKRVLLSGDQLKYYLIYYFKKEAVSFNLPRSTRKTEERFYMFYAEKIIDALLDLRLIRGDFREDQRIYEISHDTLLSPINEANKVRSREAERMQRKKEEEKQEKLLKDAKEKADKERENREEADKLRSIANEERDKANKQKEIADKERDNANNQKEIADKERDNANRQKRMATKLVFILLFILVGVGILLGRFISISEKLNTSIKLQRQNLCNSLFHEAKELHTNGEESYIIFRLVQAAKSLDSNDTRFNQFLKSHGFYELSGSKIFYNTQNKLATVSMQDSILYIWKTNTRPLSVAKKIIGVHDVKVSADNSLAAFFNDQSGIELFDLTNLKSVTTFPEFRKTGYNTDKEAAFDFISNSRILKIANPANKSVTLFDTEDSRQVTISFRDERDDYFIYRFGSLEFIRSGPNRLWIFDGYKKRVLEIEKSSSRVLNSFPATDHITSGDTSTTVLLDNRGVVSIIKNNVSRPYFGLNNIDHLISIAKDGSLVIAIDKDYRLIVFDINKKKVVLSPRSLGSSAMFDDKTFDSAILLRSYIIKSTPDCKTIFFPGKDSVYKWNPETAEISALFTARGFRTLYLTEDQKYLCKFSLSLDSFQILDLRTARPLRVSSNLNINDIVTFAYDATTESCFYIRRRNDSTQIAEYNIQSGAIKIVREIKDNDISYLNKSGELLLIDEGKAIFPVAQPDKDIGSWEKYLDLVYPKLTRDDRLKYRIDNVQLK